MNIVKKFFDKVYEEFVAGSDSGCKHSVINGVRIYSNSNRKDDDYIEVAFAGIELNKSRGIAMDNLCELLVDNYFNVELFLEEVSSRIFSPEGTDFKEMESNYFIKPLNGKVLETKIVEKEVRSERDIKNEGKVEILNQLIRKTITLK